jgi:hypothetical protein
MVERTGPETCGKRKIQPVQEPSDPPVETGKNVVDAPIHATWCARDMKAGLTHAPRGEDRSIPNIRVNLP